MAVLCVTFNSARHLPALLSSLPAALEGLRWRLWVVDNGSVDGSPDLVVSAAPDATVVRIGANLGYAAAVNAGHAAADDAASVLVLNPDVVLEPGCGSALMESLTEGVGIAVPVQLNPDGTLHPTLRREPSVTRIWGEALLGGRRAGRFRFLGEQVVSAKAYEARTTAAWATGSVLAISRACWLAVGQWDERYFLYSEETDFALRARSCGLVVQLEPRARAIHERGASHHDWRLWSLLMINKGRLFRSRHGAVSSTAFRTGLLMGELLRSWRRDSVHRRALGPLVTGERAAARLVSELGGTVAAHAADAQTA
jgi:GT2 family glycosyltransferase